MYILLYVTLIWCSGFQEIYGSLLRGAKDIVTTRRGIGGIRGKWGAPRWCRELFEGIRGVKGCRECKGCIGG